LRRKVHRVISGEERPQIESAAPLASLCAAASLLSKTQSRIAGEDDEQ